MYRRKVNNPNGGVKYVNIFRKVTLVLIIRGKWGTKRAFSRHLNDIWVTKETEGTGKTG